MKVLQPQVIFEDYFDGVEILKKIEKAGRTAYKSENKISKSSAIDFVKNIIDKGHLSVIEHFSITIRVICDRGVSHEIVRHRIASYTQESTRYCNYSKGKFGGEISVIEPSFWKDKKDEKYKIWLKTIKNIENSYMKLISLGALPQEARTILPNSLKTEIVITMNLREWRHFLELRTSMNAHPQMRDISLPILKSFKEKIPIIFDDICEEYLGDNLTSTHSI